jgi:chemosensory pili system protein ChpA (sensor histidine kinase/response regulator)
MDLTRNTAAAAPDDLSGLSWVQEELRKTLDTAHKALRRYLKEAEAAARSDLDDVDPTVLRTARQHLHQGVGALELVNLPEGAALLRASEALVQRFVAKPQRLDVAGVEAVERASYALLDYLARRLAGKPADAVGLFSQLRTLLELNGAERVHPADLWPHDFRWREVPAVAPGPVRVADAAMLSEFERRLLSLVRVNTAGAGAGATALRADCSALAAGAAQTEVVTFWRIAAGFFEAWALGLLPNDVYLKRTASRVLAQLRQQVKGVFEVSERLTLDLLFYCARAQPGPDKAAPCLRAVQRAYALGGDPTLAHATAPVDYSAPVYGRFDPGVVAQARKRVESAKLAWSDVAAQELQRIGSLPEPFSLVADSVRRLCPGGAHLATALLTTAERTAQRRAAPRAALAMEVATSLLYLEAVLEDGELDRPDEAARVERLAERLDAVAAGAPAEPLEPWMEVLYRHVADKQTMGTVVQELRSSLSEAERQIDQYFRNPRAPELLLPVPALFTTMRGVLTVLGIEPATQAVLRMREDVDALLASEPDPQAPSSQAMFLRLAGNLGALGFLIDMLNVQPQMAKTLFLFDAASGVLAPLMGRHAHAPDLVDRAHAIADAVRRDDMSFDDVSQKLQALSQQPGVSTAPGLVERVEAAQAALEHAAEAGAGPATEEAAREHIAQAMSDFVATATSPIGLDVLDMPMISSPMALDPLDPQDPQATGAAFVHTGLEDDDEMRDVFLEESREVLAEARLALAALDQAPGELSQLTTVRRAFHTLKGSSRMVGLKAFGDAAWSGEQLFNHWIASQAPASVELRTFTGDALDYFEAWVTSIERRLDSGFMPEPVIAAADTLRLAGELMRVPMPGAPMAGVPDVALPTFEALGLGDLDLELPALDALPPAPALPDEAVASLPLPVLSDTLPTDPLPVATQPVFDLAHPFEHLDLELGADSPPEPVLEPLEATQPVPLADTEVLQPAPALPDLMVDFLLEFQDTGTTPPLELAGEGYDTSLPEVPSEDEVKVIGPLRLPIPLFNIFLNEADEHSRRLGTELAEWALELHRPIGQVAITQAHSLAGDSATVGFHALCELARALEHALVRSDALGHGDAADAALFTEVADDIRRLLHQFAAGFLHAPGPELVQRLHDWEWAAAQRQSDEVVPPDSVLDLEPVTAPVPEPEADDQADRQVDHADHQADHVVDEEPVLEPEALAVEAVPSPEPPVGETEVPLPVLDEVVERAATEPAVEPRLAEPAAPRVRPEPVLLRDAVSADDLEIDQQDAADPELFPVFEEEALELLPRLSEQLHGWAATPTDLTAGAACMRTLHTFKGGARLAGAMRLGEMAHRLETAVQQLLARERVAADDLTPLLTRLDALSHTFARLRQRGAEEAEAEASVSGFAELPATLDELAEPTQAAQVAAASPAVTGSATLPEGAGAGAAEASTPVGASPLDGIDWSRFGAREAAPPVSADRVVPAAQPVRVRIQLLDRLVNMAGEVSITRARMEAEVGHIRGALGDLTDNLERLHQQLHDLSLQADTQLQSRREAARAAQQNFDPLELDRYTRVQELARMMAESVDDVSTVRGVLQRSLQSTEDELAVQGRLARELQGDLLRTRMVEFDSLSERLYRVVRQAAKETGKQVRLDIAGGSIEVDRSVLDRMTGAFEHLLRNCVTHGIELPDVREAAGKDPTGSVVVAVAQEGNEVTVEVKDDGAGLDLDRIRERAQAMGLLAADAAASDKDLANLIFTPGLSTASQVTELAGRGVGLDVVRADVQSLGGRIETRSNAGRGTRFRLVLPLTTVVTQVVLLRAGDTVIAVPSNLVELVQRATPLALETAYRQSTYLYGGLQLPFYWLGALLEGSATGTLLGRTLPVVIARSAQQRVALQVDEVLGTHEVVVKNLGPQLARVPGLAGMTLLVSGAVALIYNPVTLSAAYGEAATARMRAGLLAAFETERLEGDASSGEPPLVMVVDDSLTVRRVTQRLLEREGWRVALAKDGLEALDQLAGELPAAILCDIEMPRMDGFDLLRNIRGDARLQHLPVVMITSRIAEKHRDHALQLGANHYLGKPYSEEELLGLLRAFISTPGVSGP